jgi:pimeloyl-ACP methyl ester carboxylesterase
MLVTDDGTRIACRRRPGKPPQVMFCGGFRSDMAGSKAAALDAWAEAAGRSFVRFDYRGHGESSGDFADGTVGLWRDDALLVLDQACDGPIVLVGSSMGAWVALLVALARPARVRGLVLVAPAVDFTEALIWNRLPDDAKAALERDGVWLRPSEYADEPDQITRRLIEEGRDHLLLGGPIAFHGPVRILHGLDDATVPWQHGLRTAEALASKDVTVTLVKGGDHRMSDPADLRRLTAALDQILARIVA